jgi:nucleotide-binding universal stress UspA family protein
MNNVLSDAMVLAVTDAVVVGDDGSADSLNAVKWALADAERRGAQLVVVRGWSITSAPRPRGAEPGYVPSEDEFAAAVAEQMQDDLASVASAGTGDTGGPVDITMLPVHSSAEDALIDASRMAAITVVGARGRGLARWLGSVSTAVVRGAQGPVVVVPGRDERGSH